MEEANSHSQTDFSGRFQINSTIGRGATTVVRKATDLRTSHLVAVKSLISEHADNAVLARRFKQEAAALRLLHHVNIVRIIEECVDELGRPCMVMEFCDGSTLKELIAETRGVPIERALKIFLQIAAALVCAHEKGIVHRDMKPANIMIASDASAAEHVKLLDFGVAKLVPFQGETFQTKTQTGEMLGTIMYMSPEQCLEQELDERSDIYSFGCVMYETLTGTAPLAGRTAFETMNNHLTMQPHKLSTVRPDILWSGEVEAMLQRCVAIEPGKRFQQMSELSSKLQRLLDAFVEERSVESDDEHMPDDARMETHSRDQPRTALEFANARAEGYLENSNGTPRQLSETQQMLVLLSCIFLCAIGIGYMTSQWIVAFLGFVVIQGLIYLIFKSPAMSKRRLERRQSSNACTVITDTPQHWVDAGEGGQHDYRENSTTIAFQLFDDLDSNGDGEVSKDELLDSLRNGNLSLAERSFVLFMLEKMKALEARNLAERKVTRSDIVAYLQSI